MPRKAVLAVPKEVSAQHLAVAMLKTMARDLGAVKAFPGALLQDTEAIDDGPNGVEVRITISVRYGDMQEGFRTTEVDPRQMTLPGTEVKRRG